MTIEILVPTWEATASSHEPAPRIDDLAGRTVGIISNGKHGTVPFFEALARELRSRGVGAVESVTKPNYSAPAGDDLLAQARHWHALVAGIGD